MEPTLQTRKAQIDIALTTFRKGIVALQARRNALVVKFLDQLKQKRIDNIRKEIDGL